MKTIITALAIINTINLAFGIASNNAMTAAWASLGLFFCLDILLKE